MCFYEHVSAGTDCSLHRITSELSAINVEINEFCVCYVSSTYIMNIIAERLCYKYTAYHDIFVCIIAIVFQSQSLKQGSVRLYTSCKFR